MPKENRRVVITGIGLVTPLGPDCATSWTRLIAGDSGLIRLPSEHLAGLPRLGRKPLPPGVLHGGPSPKLRLSPDQTTREPIIDLATQAAQEAVSNAGGADRFDVDPVRAGVVFGTSKGGLRSFDRFARQQQELCDCEAARLWQQFQSDSPALALAGRYGFQASALCPVAACATGLVAIQRGVELIQRNQCDLVLAGSSDASLLPALQSSFHRLGVLAKGFHDPASACRPFDEQREGFLVGEGAAVLVLEELGHALARGVTPYAEWLGGGQTADTSALTQLEPDAPALEHLLRSLPGRLGFDWDEVDYLNLHGTGTEMNDACEAAAIQRVLEEEAERIPASSLKGALGHLLGAAGSVEMALTLLAFKYHRLPANRNLEIPFEGCRLNLLREPEDLLCPRVAIKISLGFGGHLAAGVFRAWE
jgi:3-oxoacyl-[acyl-carrier-protein] synthase II